MAKMKANWPVWEQEGHGEFAFSEGAVGKKLPIVWENNYSNNSQVRDVFAKAASALVRSCPVYFHSLGLVSEGQVE